MPSPPFVAARDVSFSYESATAPLIADFSAHFPAGFTGIIGANGAGKTTLLRLLVGALTPISGSIEGAADAVYCEQRTDDAPTTFKDFLEDWSAGAFALRGRLNIQADFLERWDCLSHGERKRAQIADALWQRPTVFAIDEPTNHIDADARNLLLDELRRYQGVGLIVSHDRELLDELCGQCLWLEPPRASVFTGGYTRARDEQRLGRDTALRERNKIVQENKRLQREMVKRRERAAGEHQARSKRGLANKDSDAREKIDRARVTDSSAGSQLRQLGGRLTQAQARLRDTRVQKTFETGIWLPGSRSRRNAVLRLEAGAIPLSDERSLSWPRVVIRPDDRIAVIGANGSGKSTFIRHIVPHLNVPEEHTINIPQEVPASVALEILREARALPSADLGHVMNVISRLNSRPDRLLASRQPSPGEVRKLLLAMGMARSPHVIVMDEPTNHLDLPSIEALESALTDCPCALMLVSHDYRFIDAIGAKTWLLEVDEQGNAKLTD